MNSQEIEQDKVYFTWKEFDAGCRHLAKRILQSKYRFYGIYGIPRGGLIVAVRLSHLLNLPIHMHNPILSKTNPKHVLICDDISDSGKTLIPYKNAGYKIATLHFRNITEVEPDFFYIYIGHKKWIIYLWEEE